MHGYRNDRQTILNLSEHALQAGVLIFNISLHEVPCLQEQHPLKALDETSLAGALLFPSLAWPFSRLSKNPRLGAEEAQAGFF